MPPSIDHFIAHKRRRRGITDRTATQYTQLLRRFHNWCRAGQIDPELVELEDMVRYLETLHLRPASLHSHVVVLRSWGRYLVDSGRRQSSPADELQGVKLTLTLRPPVTEAEIQQLVRSIDARTTRGARLLALIALWYGCALRLTESVTIERRDIDLDARELRVQGKGGGWDAVTIPEGAVPHLERWMRRSRGRMLFPGGGPGGTIHRNTAYESLRAAVRAAGFAMERWHPHMLRHACAVHMLRGGANLRTIQRHLRHRDIKMTERYLAIDTSDVRAAVDRSHPLNA